MCSFLTVCEKFACNHEREGRFRNYFTHHATTQDRRCFPLKIGILGDTHDHLPNLKKAVKLLNREAGQLFLHSGDFISPFVIPVLSSLQGEVKGVYGNNDGDHDLLQERCRETGNVSIPGNYFEMHYEGIRIALLHGHEKALLADLIESGLFDLVVHGHLHRAFVEKSGETLVINPGEVCGYLTGIPTCAVYDITKGEGRILRI